MSFSRRKSKLARKLRFGYLGVKYWVIGRIIHLLLKVHEDTAYRWLVDILTNPIRFPAPPNQQKWIASTQVEDISIGTESIRVYAKGKGPCVLLVHGWQTRGAVTFRLADALVENGFRVVTCDLPAHGHSSMARAHPYLCIQALLKVFEKFGPFESVIAHSVGGALALGAVARGITVKNLILIGTPASFETVAQMFFGPLLGFSPPLTGLERQMEITMGIPVHKIFPLYEQPLPGHVRLSFIHDRDDKRVPASESELMHKRFPDSDLLITSKLGHDGPLKDPWVIQKCCEWARRKN